MDDFEENAIAWFRQGGVELVNSVLNVEYPHPGERMRALEALEETGRWRILWHRQSMRPDDKPDFGIVTEYLGED